MRRSFVLALLVAVLATAAGELRAVEMLGSSGATAPASSACPATLEPGQVCSSGWFSIDGLDKIRIHIRNTTAAQTSTTVLYARDCPTCSAYTLQTVTNAADTEVSFALSPGVGDVKVTVSAIGGGAVKASLRAFRPSSGSTVW